MKMVNKILKLIWKSIYTLFILGVILIFIFAVVQGTSNNERSIGGTRIFSVITGSMIPVYNIGDILIVKEVIPEEIKVDDDIVYKGEKGSYRNKIITHRVLSINKKEDGNYRIITKGVANIAQDPVIDQTQVIGKVVFKIAIISFLLNIITNVYVLILIPVVILVYKNIKRIRNM